MKKGNEELEAWISRMVSPRINFKFYEIPMGEKDVVMLEIPCAARTRLCKYSLDVIDTKSPLSVPMYPTYPIHHLIPT